MSLPKDSGNRKNKGSEWVTYIIYLASDEQISYTLSVECTNGTLPYKDPAIYDIADTSLGPKCIYICLQIPEMWKLLYSIKQTSSPVLILPELYKIHFIIQHLSTTFVRLYATSGGFKDQLLDWHCISSC